MNKFFAINEFKISINYFQVNVTASSDPQTEAHIKKDYKLSRCNQTKLYWNKHFIVSSTLRDLHAKTRTRNHEIGIFVF